MPTTVNDIREWLARDDKTTHSHVVIVCDGFDHSDYPVPVKIGEDVKEIINEYKDQVRILKQEIAELQDAGKSKDSANKRCLQKLEHISIDLQNANNTIKELKETNKMMLEHP